MLYPLKFKPQLKERIWGGGLLPKVKGLPGSEGKKIGESWELSGYPGSISVVANGPLKGNNLDELIEVYMGELVGEKIFEKYGDIFPLLIKLIDARDVLSVQVHPDDALAAQRHESYGKTEMWYVVDADPGASLYVGFARKTSHEEYLEAVALGSLPSLLQRVEVKKGDAWFIPAGVIHAIGKGLVIAEIQQTSDVTYRVDDWGRVDDNGKPREMHTQLAQQAINFGNPDNYEITAASCPAEVVKLKECPYFTTNIIEVDSSIERDYASIDSFVIYICIEGSLTIECSDSANEKINRWETLLIPACKDDVVIKGEGKLLEVYIG